VITLKNAKAEDKISAVANEDLKQGQYCTIASISGEDYAMDAVDAAGDVQGTRDTLYMVIKEPINIESADSVYEDISDGDHVMIIGAVGGLLVEDTALAANSASANWAGASVGAKMVCNATGFLTLDGAADDEGTSAHIAKFVSLVNDIITYEMIGYNNAI
jgi:hypothetical protein